jgi:hypothetical protein
MQSTLLPNDVPTISREPHPFAAEIPHLVRPTLQTSLHQTPTLLTIPRKAPEQVGMVSEYIWHNGVTSAIGNEPSMLASETLHLTTPDGTARIPSIHYNNATNWLKPIKVIHDNALAVVILSDRSWVTCGKSPWESPFFANSTSVGL